MCGMRNAPASAALTQNCPRVLMCWDFRRASSSLSIRVFPWTTAALFTNMETSPTLDERATTRLKELSVTGGDTVVRSCFIQVPQLKFNVHTRWETERLRANIHAEEAERNILCCVSPRKNDISLGASGNISMNTEPSYLFSNNLCLLVYFLPIGHIAHKVMALCSGERDLFCCFFQALFCPAPQDDLEQQQQQKGQSQT